MADQRIIKVNQIASGAQALRLRKRMNLGGICIARDGDAAAPYIGMQEALALRQAVGDLPLAVSFRREDAFSEMAQALGALGAEYLEFTPVDPYKRPEFEAQLSGLAAFSQPKVANGFFVLADETSFIDEPAPLEQLRDAGVVLFQFELQSASDPTFRISKRALQRADALFSRFPTLVTDSQLQLPNYPLRSIAGFFFNLAPPREATSYDYSSTRRTESEIARLLMRLK